MIRPRPRLPLPVRPKRPMKEANVTIAIGVRTNDGVVLASDSQHTVSGYIKTDDGKVRTTIFHDFGHVFAITGAGSSDYIRMAMDKSLEGVDELNDFTEIAAKLEQNLLAFFDNHLSRWASFSDADRPTVELLIALSMKSGPFGLFHYSGTSFNRVSSKAIGAGILLANNLLQDFVSASSTLDQATSAVTYIIWKVKKQVDSCGGFTDLVALRAKGDFALTDSKAIEKAEADLTKIDREATGALKKNVETEIINLSWHSEYSRKKKPDKKEEKL